MKRSRPFPDIFQECLELILVKGETIEECLRSFPEHAQELKPLLETATATKRAMSIQPSAEFRERARQQFYTALREMPAKKKRAGFRWSWQPQWGTVAAIVLALLLVSSGTVAAASNSMPDQPLYPVKRAAEQARLALTPSTIGKAQFYARLADRRVLEIVYLASKSKPEQLQRVTRYLDAHLAQIANLASAQQTTMMSDMGRSYIPMMTAETPTLGKVAPTATPAPTTAPTTAPTLGAPPQSLGVEAVPLDEAVRIALEQRAALRALILSQAMHNPARLKAALMNVPPETRLALLRAIAVSETGYERALRSLEDQ